MMQRGRLLAADLHSKNRSKKKNYDLFGGAYWVIRLALAFLFAIIGFITILAAMNTKLNVGFDHHNFCAHVIYGNGKSVRKNPPELFCRNSVRLGRSATMRYG